MTRDKFCGILNYHFKALFDNKIVVMITHDNKNMKRSSYYHFKALFDNKIVVMITHDNKNMKRSSYYHFKALFESKEFYHDYER